MNKFILIYGSKPTVTLGELRSTWCKMNIVVGYAGEVAGFSPGEYNLYVSLVCHVFTNHYPT
jgi:hypothetical protein